ncbi:hypothetical protein [Desulfosporosinus metallidurans]|uniref:hypothetical protein n=1 Tax=Desulfosporosinus metallidurans TaxID=1888891 RepID=UPI0014799C6B|nr:hypothetical protein [Desulfosporosinus metallidurans]
MPQGKSINTLWVKARSNRGDFALAPLIRALVDQTNCSSAVWGERGSRQIRHPTTMDGLVSPEPRMAGGDLGSVGGFAHRVLSPAMHVALSQSLVTTC